MKHLLLGIMSLILLSFAACNTESAGSNNGRYADEEGLERFLTDIQPEESSWTAEEIEEYESYLKPDKFEQVFNREQVEDFLASKEIPETVTAKQAAEDVNQAFQLLAYGYGGYSYFGGDEVFLPIRDNILAELEVMDEIRTKDLWKLLWEALSPVVIDNHFYITMDDPDTYVSDREYLQHTYFVRDLYFDDPTGVDSQYVKHTIGPDGAITYCLTAVCQDAENLPDSMTIEGVEQTLEWSLAKPIRISSKEREAVFSETKVGGKQLPVLRNTSLLGEEDKLKEFAATAATYKEEPVMVLDLRGNIGGQDTYATLWLKNFCNKEVDHKVLYSTKQSNLHKYIAGKSCSAVLGNWITTTNSGGTVWENDTLVFVLIDENIASSGECFTAIMNMGKRVILVGSNTAGCVNFGNASELYLPNSGICMYFGMSIAFYDSLDKQDGIGFFPDLWVEPGKSLDAVVRLCKYYGLIEDKSNFWDLFLQ